MIKLLLLSYLSLIVSSYFLEVVPQVFLVTTIIISFVYSKSVSIRVIIVLTGFITDIFFFNQFLVFTPFYYLVFIILHQYFKQLFVLNLQTLSIMVFIFLILQKIIFLFIEYSLKLQKGIISGYSYTFFEIVVTVVVGGIIYLILEKGFTNREMERIKNY